MLKLEFINRGGKFHNFQLFDKIEWEIILMLECLKVILLNNVKYDQDHLQYSDGEVITSHFIEKHKFDRLEQN